MRTNKAIFSIFLFSSILLSSCGGGSPEATPDTPAQSENTETTIVEEKSVAEETPTVETEVTAENTEVKEEVKVKEEEPSKTVTETKEEPKQEEAEVKLKKLTTSIPPVSVVGTPAPIKVPNLKAKPLKAPSIQVPTNTKLLSKGKTVTSSDDFPIIGELSLITDGEKEAGEGYFVELLDGLQWVQIDLEKSSTIEGVWVWHYHSQDRAYHDVIIQVSDDAEFSSGVTTIFNNDYDNSASLGKGGDKPYVESNFGMLVNAKKAKGRYVRLYSNNNSATEANNYIEVEVYGVN